MGHVTAMNTETDSEYFWYADISKKPSFSLWGNYPKSSFRIRNSYEKIMLMKLGERWNPTGKIIGMAATAFKNNGNQPGKSKGLQREYYTPTNFRKNH